MDEYTKEEWKVEIVVEDVRGMPLRSPMVVVEHKGERIEFSKLAILHLQLTDKLIGSAQETIREFIKRPRNY